MHDVEENVQDKKPDEPARASEVVAIACSVLPQRRAEGGRERGDGPGHPKQGCIQRVKLQKFHFMKFQNYSFLNKNVSKIFHVTGNAQQTWH